MKKPYSINYKQLFVLILSLPGFTPSLEAQTSAPPLPVEFLFSDKQLYFQMVVKKQFAPEGRLGYFTVATYSSSYDDFSNVKITMPMHLYYNIWKGFSPVGGAAINSVVGFSPYTGLQHNYSSRKILSVTVASFYINAEHDFKVFGLYEYKPRINENWSLYSRLQFMYNTSLKEGTHNRSYIYLRVGVKKESLIFGLGANLDQYGPFKTFEDNYGAFVRWEFR
jgi:hypothetical protein